MTETVEKRIGAYIGRRLQMGKLQHCFLGEDGDEFWYPKARPSLFKGARIGTTYDLTGALPSLWSDKALSTAPDQTRLKWQVKDRAAYQIKMERAGSASPELDQAVTALKLARARLPRSQASAFDAWLLNKIR
ncbi:MAG: hypothetical protein F4X83_12285 [Chloroflexi bacterium]|nr:hypothetical protein [Chloroflexota bacterium]